jgi:hypothetical protein
MSDVDDLAFDIAFALTQKPIGAEARKLIASLPDEAVDNLSRVVAEHLLHCGWQRAAATPGATADSASGDPASIGP